MRIHVRKIKISQDRQNGKKSKCWLDLKKSNFEFDLNIKLPYCYYNNLNNNTCWDLTNLPLSYDMQLAYACKTRTRLIVSETLIGEIGKLLHVVCW